MVFFQVFVFLRQTALAFYLRLTVFFQVFVYLRQIGMLFLLLTADSVFIDVCVPTPDSLLPFTYS